MNTQDLAREIRLLSLELCHSGGTSHIGGAFSISDILAVLYQDIARIFPEAPDNPKRDRIFFSKGHACTAMYSVLAIKNYFTTDELKNNFIKNSSYFTSHINHNLPGVELSTGSLGHALGVACGSALAIKRKARDNRVFALLSDGELDEGSNWEAILFAAHQKLDNLIAIIDYNKIQSFGTTEEVLNLESLSDKFKAFNWEVEEVDGHDIQLLQTTLRKLSNNNNTRPKCLIAHTVKGKGVSFMENRLLWHYRSPSNDEYLSAKQELISAS